MNLKTKLMQLDAPSAILEVADNDPTWLRLSEAVDDSPFDLAEWASALKILHAWLESRALNLEFREQIDYLACASEGLGPVRTNAVGLFANVVQEYLEIHGVEKATARVVLK